MQRAELQREIIIAHASVIAPATSVRSTLLQSSLAALQAHGHLARYLERVSPRYRAQITESIAPSWVPLDVALAHYQACDELELTDEQMAAMGEATGDRVQGAFMETLTRAGRTLGVTPWLLLKRFDALWSRLIQGGSIEVIKVGPKDTLIEVCGATLPRYAYFRTAFCGVVATSYKYVGVRKSYVHVSHWNAQKNRFVMRAAWV